MKQIVDTFSDCDFLIDAKLELPALDHTFLTVAAYWNGNEYEIYWVGSELFLFCDYEKD